MCREVGCQRRALPESPYCDTHRRAILTAAFAQTSRETEEERGRFPPMAPAPSRRAPERFWSKVDETAGCWTWTGALRKGYGAFQVGTKGQPRLVGAHRFAFELLRGPIPTGMQLDHLCRNRACVNPDHLEIVTGRENTMRGEGFSARNARKATCPRGHTYESRVEAVALRRYCGACNRDRLRRAYVRVADRVSTPQTGA